jgi:hypothetical protein
MNWRRTRFTSRKIAVTPAGRIASVVVTLGLSIKEEVLHVQDVIQESTLRNRSQPGHRRPRFLTCRFPRDFTISCCSLTVTLEEAPQSGAVAFHRNGAEACLAAYARLQLLLFALDGVDYHQHSVQRLAVARLAGIPWVDSPYTSDNGRNLGSGEYHHKVGTNDAHGSLYEYF